MYKQQKGRGVRPPRPPGRLRPGEEVPRVDTEACKGREVQGMNLMEQRKYIWK